MNRDNGHIEHWQLQENAEADRRGRRLTQAEESLASKDEQIRQLTAQLADAASTGQCKDQEIACLGTSLGSVSATLATLCELQIAGRYGELRAEISRLAANYAQIKSAVAKPRLH